MSEVIQHRGSQIRRTDKGFEATVGTRTKVLDTLRKAKRWAFCEARHHPRKDAPAC